MSKLQRLSQGHLKVLDECPRKFEHIYLNSLFSPTEPDQYQNMQRGSDFHRLMHQRELGLPIEPLLVNNPDLGRTMVALQTAAPQLFSSSAQTYRESEQVRTILVGHYLFTAIYDLVLLGSQAQIVDWKTHGQPRQPERLAQDWQTRLYMYILAETSDYPPAAISFTYWFVQCQPPQSITFPYGLALHQQTAADLELLLAKASSWLDAYPQPFPMVDPAAQLCPKCHFAARCGRRPQPGHALDPEQLTMELIAEISI